MLLHRSQRAGLVTLLGSAAAALLGAILVVQPGASASVQPAPGPALPSEAEAPASGIVVFRATADATQAGTDSFTGPPTSSSASSSR
jgi:hypothetical protein